VRDNQWTQAPDIEPPDFPDFMWAGDNVWTVPATVFPDVGQEALLFIIDPTDDARALASLKPFQLHCVAGAVGTPHGTIGYVVFAVMSPSGGPPYAAWERFFDPFGDGEVIGLRALADQTHWHVIVLGRGPEVLNVLEFENVYEFEEALAGLSKVCGDQPLTDFQAAASSVQDRFTTLQLFQMGEQDNAGRQSPEDALAQLLGQLRDHIEAENRAGVQAVGDELFNGGGMQLMHLAHRVYAQTYGDDGQPRLIDIWWSGIGEWQG